MRESGRGEGEELGKGEEGGRVRGENRQRE